MNARRRVFVALGDSLTQQGSDPATSGWVARLQYAYVRSADVQNRGFSGFTTRWIVQQVLPSLRTELIEQAGRIELVTLWLGANDAALKDGRSGDQHVPLEEFRVQLSEIIKAIRDGAPTAKLLLLTPPPVDEQARLELCESPALLDRSVAAVQGYAQAVVDIAAAERLEVLDVYAMLMQMEPPQRHALFSDGLHFNMQGNEFIFDQIQAKIHSSFPHLDPDALPWPTPDWKTL